MTKSWASLNYCGDFGGHPQPPIWGGLFENEWESLIQYYSNLKTKAATQNLNLHTNLRMRITGHIATLFAGKTLNEYKTSRLFITHFTFLGLRKITVRQAQCTTTFYVILTQVRRVVKTMVEETLIWDL